MDVAPNVIANILRKAGILSDWENSKRSKPEMVCSHIETSLPNLLSIYLNLPFPRRNNDGAVFGGVLRLW